MMHPTKAKSTKDMDTKLTTFQQRALRALLDGTHSASDSITARGIALSAGIAPLKSPAAAGEAVRAIVHALRMKGYPICSSSRGYFYARRPEDLSRYIVRLQSRISSVQEALDGVKGSWHNVGRPGSSSDDRPYVELWVRTERDTSRKVRFPLDAAGNPVIPAGTRVMR